MATYNGNASDNTYTGTAAADYIYGNGGNDTLNGESGNDYIDGGGGNDSLSGGAGTDTLYGGDGNDTLTGGTGNDSLEGGNGADIYRFTAGDGADRIYNYDTDASVDVVSFSGLATTKVTSVIRTQGTDNLVIRYGTGDSLTVESYFDGYDPIAYRVDQFAFTDATWTWNEIQARAAIITGTASPNSLTGFDGWSNTISGLAGDDNLYGGDAGDLIDGGTDNDYLDGGGGNDSLIGGTGNDDLSGGDGNDTLTGGTDDLIAGATDNDTLDGGGGNDSLSGGAGTDTLYGGDGNDTLTGGTGNDSLEGGNGADIYRFTAGDGADRIYNYDTDASVDVVSFSGLATTKVTSVIRTQGTDNLVIRYGTGDSLTVESYFDGYDPIAYRVDQFAFTDATWTWNEIQARAAIITGTASPNSLTGFDGWSNTISGLAGDDNLYGGDAGDLIDGGTDNDYLDGGGGNDSLIGGTGNDDLSGGDGNDTLTGGTDDLIAGATDNDTLDGGGGNDSLSGGAGTDTLYGGDGNDTLTGGTGNDSLEGGNGADIYLITKADGKDEIYNYDADASTDVLRFTDMPLTDLTSVTRSGDNLVLAYRSGSGVTVDYYFSSAAYRINRFEFVGGDTLTNLFIGTDAKNVLNGGATNDALSGLGGADTLNGGAGNDLYFVDHVGELVNETAGAGTDTVLASIDYTLTANVERLALLAGAATATGNDLANVLTGNGANNTLNGGLGADTLIGGAGDDTYMVDDAGDLVIENIGEGADTVAAAITYTLVDNVERLSLIGTSAIKGTGNTLANTLIGNNANNTLNGRGGADTLSGGAGNDVYVVDNTGDTVIEAISEGTDTVKSAKTYSLGDNIERLTLTGAAAISGTGNDLANLLTGNDGANTLDGGVGNDQLIGKAGDDTLIGGAGNDTLIGGAGTDSLTGGVGADRFKFLTAGDGIDSLTDFVSKSDKVQVVSANFGALPVGNLVASQFVTAGTPLTSGDAVFIYDGTTGALAFDADGSGLGAAVQFATLTGPTAMRYSDLQVVAA